MERLIKTLVCVMVLFNTKCTYGHSILTSRLVDVPEPTMVDIRYVVEQDIDYRYSDEDMGITALKSKALHACFVMDYDPFWLPSDEDLNELMADLPPLQYDEKIEKLETQAGDVITHMCGKVQVYWFAGPPLPPGPLLINQGNQPPPPDNKPSQNIVSTAPKMPPLFGGLNELKLTNPTHIDVPEIAGPTPPPLEELISANGPENGAKGDVKKENNIGQDRSLDLVAPPFINMPYDGPPTLPALGKENANNGSPDLIAPPLINDGNNMMPFDNHPPLLDLGMGNGFGTDGGSDLIAPPLINDGFMPFDTPPPLAQLLGMRNIDGGGPRPQAPPSNDLEGPPLLVRVAPIVPMVRSAHVDYAQTLAPPLPDFKTPAMRRFK